MDSIIDKILDSIGVKNKISQSRRNDRYYDDKYDVLRKRTSSTVSSQSKDDDEHYNVERHSSTVGKVEDLVSQMFESCTANMKGMWFDHSQSPRSSDQKDRRRPKDGNNYNATNFYDQNVNDNGIRASRSRFSGISQRNRGRKSLSRKRRSISRPGRRKPLPDITPLPDNKTMLYVQNDDDEVSALSAGTLNEMASRQQRLILLHEANRKDAVAHRPSYSPNNVNIMLQSNGENLDSIQTGKLQNISEDLKSFMSVSSANTTEFESIWNEHPKQAVSAQSAGIYEKRLEMSEEATLDATRLSHISTLRELDTPLSRKLRRCQVSQAIEENDDEDFSLRPDEEEI